jgi:hypothetical protein
MNPHTASNAAGLILAPFFLISAMQFGRWLIEWLGLSLTGWLT